MSATTDHVLAVFEREFATISRARAYRLVALGFVAVIIALGLVGGVASYVGVVLNLLTPVAVLLPTLCAALGYRALLADAEAGEIDVLRTFPLSRTAYVGGVLAGRLTVVVSVILFALGIVGLVVPFFPTGSNEFLLRRTTYNGPLLYVRFCVLTAVATVVFFTVISAISAIGRTADRALAFAIFLVVTITVGLDLVIIGGFATDIVSPETLPWLLALSPVSAYRGLVLALVVEPAVTSQLQSGSVVANCFGLVLWFAGSLFVAIRFVWD